MADKVETATPDAGIEFLVLSIPANRFTTPMLPSGKDVITAVNAYDSNLATIQSQRETIEALTETLSTRAAREVEMISEIIDEAIRIVDESRDQSQAVGGLRGLKLAPKENTK